MQPALPLPPPASELALRIVDRIADRVGADDFYDRLVDALCNLTQFDCGEVIRFGRVGPPESIASRLQMDGRDIAPDAYFGGFYADDPVYHALDAGIAAGCYDFGALVASTAGQTDFNAYNANYYSRTCLAHEVDMFFPTGRGEGVVIWAACHSPRARSKPDAAPLHAVTPVLRSLIAGHQRLDNDGPDGERFTPAELIALAMRNFGAALMSRREAEVLRLLLQGCSPAQTAARLGVTEGTAKNHRKAVYRKLDVTGQAELLSLFVQALPLATRSNDPFQRLEARRPMSLG